MKKTFFFFNACLAFLVISLSCTKKSAVQKDPASPETNTPGNVPVEKKYTAQYSKIWDLGAHNAFTDLVRFKNAFYCVFREASSHTAHDGLIRVLKSTDGNTWTPVKWYQKAPVSPYIIDLRDPKISVTPDNRLMIMADVEYWLANSDGTYTRQNFRPYVSFSDVNGENFDDLQSVQVNNPTPSNASYWIWRSSWNSKGEGYGFDYISPLTLFTTTNGKTQNVVTQVTLPNSPNESTIRFDKQNNMYVLVRCESGTQNGVLMVAPPPYFLFTKYTLPQRIGGPDFLFLTDSTLCIGSRLYTAGKPDSTALFVSDLKGAITKKLSLPSGGDCSYPGMVLYNDTLWVSYYSSHTGKTSIHFAKVPVPLLTGK